MCHKIINDHRRHASCGHIYDSLDYVERCEKAKATKRECDRNTGQWREMERPCRICRKDPVWTEWDGFRDRRGTVHPGVFNIEKTLKEVNGKKMLADGCLLEERKYEGCCLVM